MPVGRVDRYDDIGGDVAEKARAASLGALRRAHVVVLVVDVYSAVKTERVSGTQTHTHTHMQTRALAGTFNLAFMARAARMRKGSAHGLYRLSSVHTLCCRASQQTQYMCPHTCHNTNS